MRKIGMSLAFAVLVFFGACTTNNTEAAGTELPVEDISGTTATDQAETATTAPDSTSVVLADSLLKK